MLMICAYTGSVVSMLFIFISPTIYYLAPILVIIGVTSLGFSFVLLNAFLPLLVAAHPSEADLKSFNSESSTSLDQNSKASTPTAKVGHAVTSARISWPRTSNARQSYPAKAWATDILPQCLSRSLQF